MKVVDLNEMNKEFNIVIAKRGNGAEQYYYDNLERWKKGEISDYQMLIIRSAVHSYYCKRGLIR